MLGGVVDVGWGGRHWVGCLLSSLLLLLSSVRDDAGAGSHRHQTMLGGVVNIGWGGCCHHCCCRPLERMLGFGIIVIIIK